MSLKYLKKIPWTIFNEYLFQFRNLTYKITKNQKIIEKRYKERPLYSINTVNPLKILYNIPRKTTKKLFLSFIFPLLLSKSQQLEYFRKENSNRIVPWIFLHFFNVFWKNQKKNRENLRIAFLSDQHSLKIQSNKMSSRGTYSYVRRCFSKKNTKTFNTISIFLALVPKIISPSTSRSAKFQSEKTLHFSQKFRMFAITCYDANDLFLPSHLWRVSYFVGLAKVASVVSQHSQLLLNRQNKAEKQLLPFMPRRKIILSTIPLCLPMGIKSVQNRKDVIKGLQVDKKYKSICKKSGFAPCLHRSLRLVALLRKRSELSTCIALFACVAMRPKSKREKNNVKNQCYFSVSGFLIPRLKTKNYFFKIRKISKIRSLKKIQQRLRTQSQNSIKYFMVKKIQKSFLSFYHKICFLQSSKLLKFFLQKVKLLITKSKKFSFMSQITKSTNQHYIEFASLALLSHSESKATYSECERSTCFACIACIAEQAMQARSEQVFVCPFVAFSCLPYYSLASLALKNKPHKQSNQILFCKTQQRETKSLVTKNKWQKVNVHRPNFIFPTFVTSWILLLKSVTKNVDYVKVSANNLSPNCKHHFRTSNCYDKKLYSVSIPTTQNKKVFFITDNSEKQNNQNFYKKIRNTFFFSFINPEYAGKNERNQCDLSPGVNFYDVIDSIFQLNFTELKKNVFFIKKNLENSFDTFLSLTFDYGYTHRDFNRNSFINFRQFSTFVLLSGLKNQKPQKILKLFFLFFIKQMNDKVLKTWINSKKLTSIYFLTFMTNSPFFQRLIFWKNYHQKVWKNKNFLFPHFGTQNFFYYDRNLYHFIQKKVTIQFLQTIVFFCSYGKTLYSNPTLLSEESKRGKPYKQTLTELGHKKLGLQKRQGKKEKNNLCYLSRNERKKKVRVGKIKSDVATKKQELKIAQFWTYLFYKKIHKSFTFKKTSVKLIKITNQLFLSLKKKVLIVRKTRKLFVEPFYSRKACFILVTQFVLWKLKNTFSFLQKISTSYIPSVVFVKIPLPFDQRRKLYLIVSNSPRSNNCKERIFGTQFQQLVCEASLLKSYQLYHFVYTPAQKNDSHSTLTLAALPKIFSLLERLFYFLHSSLASLDLQCDQCDRLTLLAPCLLCLLSLCESNASKASGTLALLSHSESKQSERNLPLGLVKLDDDYCVYFLLRSHPFAYGKGSKAINRSPTANRTNNSIHMEFHDTYYLPCLVSKTSNDASVPLSHSESGRSDFFFNKRLKESKKIKVKKQENVMACMFCKADNVHKVGKISHPVILFYPLTLVSSFYVSLFSHFIMTYRLDKVQEVQGRKITPLHSYSILCYATKLVTMKYMANVNQFEMQKIFSKVQFNFLGFYFSSKNFAKKFDLIPSKINIRIHLMTISNIIKLSKTKTQEDILIKLTPIIRLWANQYCNVSTKKIFHYCDYVILKIIWKWACRRHPKKSKKWIKSRYFIKLNGKKWIFGLYTKNPKHFLAQFSSLHSIFFPRLRHSDISKKGDVQKPNFSCFLRKEVKAKKSEKIKLPCVFRRSFLSFGYFAKHRFFWYHYYTLFFPLRMTKKTGTMAGYSATKPAREHKKALYAFAPKKALASLAPLCGTHSTRCKQSKRSERARSEQKKNDIMCLPRRGKKKSLSYLTSFFCFLSKKRWLFKKKGVKQPRRNNKSKPKQSVSALIPSLAFSPQFLGQTAQSSLQSKTIIVPRENRKITQSVKIRYFTTTSSLISRKTWPKNFERIFFAYRKKFVKKSLLSAFLPRLGPKKFDQHGYKKKVKQYFCYLCLPYHTDTALVHYNKVKINKSPYDANFDYWYTRLSYNFR